MDSSSLLLKLVDRAEVIPELEAAVRIPGGAVLPFPFGRSPPMPRARPTENACVRMSLIDSKLSCSISIVAAMGFVRYVHRFKVSEPMTGFATGGASTA